MSILDTMGRCLTRRDVFFPVRLIIEKTNKVGLKYETLQISKCHERLTLVSLTSILTYTIIT